LYQQKWGGDPMRLKSSIARAVAMRYENTDDLLHIVRNLRSAGATTEASNLLFNLSAELRKKAESDPGNAQLHEDLARLYAEREIWGNSAKEYKKVMLLRPHDESAYFNLASAYAKTSQPEEAILVYREVLKFNPKSFPALVLLSEKLAVNHPDEGVTVGRKAIALHPELPKGYTMTGDNLIELERFTEALPLYNKAISMDKFDYEAYRGQSYCYAKTGKKEKALQLALKLVQRDAYDLRNSYALCWAYQANAQYDLALQILDRLISLTSPSTEMACVRGDLLWSLHRKEEAQTAWEKAISLNTNERWRGKARKALSKISSV
ncbi:MAG: tetratricopeptide repeat protein, partial [Chthonomonadaceae bacterium]|nr:tetratricopeptide repeat protein [Chthonomonadaceae bacterium]